MLNNPYEDMLYMPHPTSKTHPRMSVEKRAAQFAPFAALTGHADAVEETARITQERVELFRRPERSGSTGYCRDIQLQDTVVLFIFFRMYMKEGGSLSDGQRKSRKNKRWETIRIWKGNSNSRTILNRTANTMRKIQGMRDTEKYLFFSPILIVGILRKGEMKCEHFIFHF